jgi:hypothetical protein
LEYGHNFEAEFAALPFDKLQQRHHDSHHHVHHPLLLSKGMPNQQFMFSCLNHVAISCMVVKVMEE